MMTTCCSIQNARCEELHLHAENLSRRVWELLMLLPTCPKMLQAFQNISDDTVSHLGGRGRERERETQPRPSQRGTEPKMQHLIPVF